MDQTDIPASKARSLGLVAIGLAFLGGSAAYLYYVGDRGRGGTFAEFAMYGGLLLGLGGIVAGLRELVRSGPIVSVGPRGIFDRRMASDWIPWAAIEALTPLNVSGQNFLTLRVDAAQEAALPFTTWGRRMAAMNRGFGGYAIGATTLAGGYPALLDAVRRHAPAEIVAELPPTDQS